jgi:hypothetical protein
MPVTLDDDQLRVLLDYLENTISDPGIGTAPCNRLLQVFNALELARNASDRSPTYVASDYESEAQKNLSQYFMYRDCDDDGAEAWALRGRHFERLELARNAEDQDQIQTYVAPDYESEVHENVSTCCVYRYGEVESGNAWALNERHLDCPELARDAEDQGSSQPYLASDYESEAREDLSQYYLYWNGEENSEDAWDLNEKHFEPARNAEDRTQTYVAPDYKSEAQEDVFQYMVYKD